jgi:hypothetical protein
MRIFSLQGNHPLILGGASAKTILLGIRTLSKDRRFGVFNIATFEIKRVAPVSYCQTVTATGVLRPLDSTWKWKRFLLVAVRIVTYEFIICPCDRI